LRTYVLDTSALFALVEKKPGALKVNEILKESIRGHCRTLMSAVNYGELYALLLRGKGEEEALRTMVTLGPLPIVLQDATAQRCFRAAELKTKYKLYYVDAFAAALSLEHKATLVTSDSDFRRLGHDFPIVRLRA
jgi:predicted nucleic acid-binding protein